MSERYSPYRPNTVRDLSESQYENIWEGQADARRSLYPYEVPPWEERQPYNIWEDMAEQLDLPNITKIVEFGTNDGYFHSILRHKGFAGSFIGIDIEGKDLPAIELIAREHIARLGIEGAGAHFIQGDVQNLSGIIESDSTPVVAANFVTYHTDNPKRVLSELYRILEKDGLGLISSRNVNNQKDIWEVARWVAHSHGFAFTQELSANRKSKAVKFIRNVPTSTISVYSHFDIDRTREYLNSNSRKLKILHEHVQDTNLWVPTDKETGIFDLCRAVESLLPYTRSIKSYTRPSAEDMQLMHDWIFEHMWHYFYSSGQKNQHEYDLERPYHISHAAQGYFLVQAIK